MLNREIGISRCCPAAVMLSKSKDATGKLGRLEEQ